MEDSNKRILNPWLFHLQKLALELKCQICLDLLNQPVLLPCDHLFCNSCIRKPTKHCPECPACKTQYVDQDIRAAPYMENVVAVYRNLCSTSLAQIFHPISSAVSRQSDKSPPLDITNHGIKKEPPGILAEGNSTKGKSMSSPNGGNTSTIVGKMGGGDMCGCDQMIVDDEDRLTEFQPPGQVRNGHMVDVGVKVINADQAEQLSLGKTCSSSEMSRDAKRQKKSNSSEAYDDNNCGFCHSSEVTDETGPMLHYANQELVYGDLTSLSNVINAHKVCVDWTPMVYYENNKIKNLESELARASKLKCSSCGKKGAALGCYVKTCRKTYHIPCASKISNIRWDFDNFLLLCPYHKSTKFPRKTTQNGKHGRIKRNSLSAELTSKHSNVWSTSPHGAKTWVFCGSDLSSMDLCCMVKYASCCGATVSKFWSPAITHVIAATDANGACTRTTKYLLAILNGQWIVSMDWIKSCAEANGPVDEIPYEITLDNHGARDGPKTGRHLALDNGRNLFDCLKFYFSGNFDPALMKDLKLLVNYAGGTVVENKEDLISQSRDAKETSNNLIVYDVNHIRECTSGYKDSHVLKTPEAAEDLVETTGSRIIKHTWILDSIAACRLQTLPSLIISSTDKGYA